VHFEKDDCQSALKDVNEAIRLEPEFAFALNLRGLVRQEVGNFIGAIQDFSDAIRIKPDFSDAFYNRGLARKAAGDKQGGRADFRESMRLGFEPDDYTY